ncbi:HEAT repeat domain-containing protein [Thalassospira sp.]|uniref:HEAT repeat domain-containing protein n=1 Tax=Thalassospira sp. TaxID=1912094 RepID=UPI0027334A55|nr:HEAT repeat domain-containing protein [Thalassospira sp.]MDP2700132.1 HEAT repeat domain-containing protein [Thalassospira sp.]
MVEPQPLDTHQLERVRQIAVDCLSKKGEEGLSHDLNEEDLVLLETVSSIEFTVSRNVLKFSDPECRNQFASEHFFERDQHQEDFAPIATALEIRNQEGWREHGAAGRYLALAHSRTDIFQCAANSVVAENHSTFDVLDVVQSALPYIDVPSVDGLISLCDAQYEHTKRDLMQGRFFTVFADCYQGNLDLFRLIIEAVREGLKNSTASLYTMSLLRISETEPEETIGYIFRDVNTTNPVLRANATWALGRLFLLHRVPETKLSDSTDYLSEAVTNANEEIRLAAYMALAEGALIHPPLTDTLNNLLEKEDQDLLRTLALVIFQRTDEAETSPYFDGWVMALSALSANEEAALDNLDFVLAGLLKKGRQEFVLSVLETWILRNAGDMPKTKELTKLFDSTFHKLLNDEDMRSRMMTSWLIRDEYQMQKAADAILSELHLCKVHQITFSQDMVKKFDKDDLILLIRRMLGYVNDEEHLLSLLFSLLSVDGADENPLPLVKEVLTKEVGFDFPASTCDRLKELRAKSKNPEIQHMCEYVIKSIDDYFDALKALPQIKELRPSHDLQVKIQKEHGKTMAAYKKAAEEKSIVRQLATCIPLKAGSAFFSFRDGEIGESSHLQSFSHSITLPRRYVQDTVGYELSRLIHRNSKKGQ